METNQEKLNRFFDEGIIDIARGPIFDKAPEPFPEGVDFGRVEAMMLTLAIGDSLGVTSEGKNPDARRQWNKGQEVRDYVPNPKASDGRGYPSDDTQLSFWTLECINEDGGLVPGHVAERFCRDRIFGIGGTVKEFIRNYKSDVLTGIRPAPRARATGP